MKTLEQTLKYKNEELVLRIQKSLGISRRRAQIVFKDTLRWLWLCGKSREMVNTNIWASQKIKSMSMPEFLLPIDMGWHEFILNTKSYSEFCEHHFNHFIHHTPSQLGIPKHKMEPEILSERQLQIYLTFWIENLGHNTVKRWIKNYPLWSEELVGENQEERI